MDVHALGRGYRDLDVAGRRVRQQRQRGEEHRRCAEHHGAESVDKFHHGSDAST
jgi:hypothetical protein